jgi:hypothetical protein
MKEAEAVTNPQQTEPTNVGGGFFRMMPMHHDSSS